MVPAGRKASFFHALVRPKKSGSCPYLAGARSSWTDDLARNQSHLYNQFETEPTASVEGETMSDVGETNWERTKAEIRSKHLKRLAAIADTERQAFFDRNPRQIDRYRDRYLCTALCQGAALHFLGRGDGVKDFDVHFFYRQNPEHPMMARGAKAERAEFNDFGVKEVHFLRTVVPPEYVEDSEGIVEALHCFLEETPTSNARHLAKKAVIGLHPKSLFERVIWPEEE